MVAVLDEASLDRLLGKLTVDMRRAFLDAIERLKGQVDVDRIAALLQAGRVQEAMGVVDARLVTAGLQPLAAKASYATVFAAQVASGAVIDLAGYGVAFDQVETEATEYQRNNQMRLIREMGGDALASVRVAILQGQTEGRNPRDVARDVRQFIGLTERQTKAVMNYRQFLETMDRQALERELRDRRFDSTVYRSIDTQKPLSPEQIDKFVNRYQERYLKLRSETIARTEALRAANAGAHLAYKQQIKAGFLPETALRRKWVYTHDARTREAHRMIPYMNPTGVGLSEPFKTEFGPIMYPGDPFADPANTINCRCTVIHDIDIVAMKEAA